MAAVGDIAVAAGDIAVAGIVAAGRSRRGPGTGRAVAGRAGPGSASGRCRPRPRAAGRPRSLRGRGTSGLRACSACYAGPIARLLLRGGDEREELGVVLDRGEIRVARDAVGVGDLAVD